MRLLVVVLGGLLSMSFVAAKTGPTYYTPERIAIGKQNAERDWGQGILRAIQAGECIAQTDDFIWMMQPTTKIPRVLPNHDTLALCPVHGDKVRELNAWTAWTTDPIHHPYKVRCRLGGEWYPSNDYLNGDMTSGEFPDDGSGCNVGDQTFYFLMEYAHPALALAGVAADR